MNVQSNPTSLLVRGRSGNPSATLEIDEKVFPATVGRSGLLAAGILPSEGDGATPIGRFDLRQVFFRPDRVLRPVTNLPVIPIRPGDLWCDDPMHPMYNRPVSAPFPARNEKLWLPTRSYDICVVLGFNLVLPTPGLGSAIFFHLTRLDDSPPPTEGCVAVAPEVMARLLPRLGIGSTMTVVLD